ncbi:MAG: nucleotidyltransferase domain-containing protein [Nanoarchaeota archaeon]|nr:nucleotidyltransferase domain-containing protein [Nanoarchaeota archaeon]
MKFAQMLKEKDARRIFGRREIEIMLKQLEGKPLTQSERNRLSRDIKPKLEFIKGISAYQDEFRLRKNQSNTELIERTIKVILEDRLKDSIKAILLFGSFADKTYTNRSDIDICVVLKESLSSKDATEFRMRVMAELPKMIDVQVFSTLPQKVKRNIARNHKVLFKGEGFDNLGFTIKYLKDESYFLRKERIFGAEA